MFRNLKYKKSIVSILLLIVFIFLINIIVSFAIEKKLTELLLNNNSKYYVASIEKVNFKLITRSLILKGIFLSPTNDVISDLKRGKSSKNTLEKISVSSIKLKGIGLFKLVFKNSIEVNTLSINNLLIQKFEISNLSKKKVKEKISLNIDSIYINTLNGVQIRKIKLANFKFQVFNFSTNKITFQNSPISFETSGFKLEKYDEHLFKLKPIDDIIEIHDINLNFEKLKYQFLIDVISYNFSKHIIAIEKVHLKPLQDRKVLANTYKYNKDVFDVFISDLKIYNYNLAKTLNLEGVFIDSIIASGLEIDIYKDKRKPFDTDERPKLPHMALKQMKMPLHINKIKIDNGNLKLENRLNKRDVSMKISMDDIHAQITNITSIKTLREKPLKVDIQAKFMKSSDMQVNIVFPLKDNQNTFYFNGSLGPVKLRMFDTAIFPVLGLKVLKGDLDGLTFSASANNISSSGKMTMLYHDLEAEVYKSNSLEENKFLSWTVNRVIRGSNPGKNNKIREVTMQYNRSDYKGIGNYFWKTLQSGIVNTMAPFGIKTEKEKKRKKITN